jgi:DNA modification methylase
VKGSRDVEVERVVHGDCLDVLSDLPDECIDLCYADPPFATGKMQSAEAATYDDRWEDIDAYLSFMRKRLDQIARVLKPHGSILLHCDWRTSHHFRLQLEELFGAESFVNHLIWSYGLGGSSPRRFARKHDDILFHTKGPEYYFDPPRVPATSVRMRGQLKKATDVIEIPSINNMANERNGYPTQKPLALLEMLVQACCPRDGVVLDPFCGSGTTLAAAARLGRKWIGIDLNEDAVRIARERIERSTMCVAGGDAIQSGGSV